MNFLLLVGTIVSVGIAQPQNDPGTITPPVLASQPDNCLSYSPEALTKAVADRTVLAYQVSADGTVVEVIVAASSGSSDLDQAAASCVRQWHFQPAMKYGVAVAANGGVAIAWPKK